jgi:hypothetical protein
MNRKEKLDKLLEIAPPLEAELEVPECPPRFVVLEQDDSGFTLCMFMGDNLEELRDVIATSETHFVEEVRVHDLDTDTVLVPVWRVERFETLEDSFSYEDGYATVR